MVSDAAGDPGNTSPSASYSRNPPPRCPVELRTPETTALIHPAAAKPIHARIELGRWLAECGTPYCRTALHLPYADGFLCPACGRAQDVIWPDPETARQIVTMLGYRPDWLNRNWLPGETALDLLRENLAHGIDHTSHPELGAAASTFYLDDTASIRVLEQPLIIDAAPRPALAGGR